MHPTGIDRVCLAYLDRFGPKAQAVIQHRHFRRILNRQASDALFEILSAPGRNFRLRFVHAAVRHWRLPNCTGQGRIYLNLGHTGLDSDGFRSWVEATDVRPIYFVHDLIPITHPDCCRSGEDARHRKRMRTVLATAAGVIGNSRATIDELAQFARAEGLSEPPAVAAWLGCDFAAPPPAVIEPPRPTFVSLGTIEARKNHALLLGIWSRLVDRLGDAAPRLLVIGQRGWEAEDVFRQLDENALLSGHVVELNSCSDDDLSRHLASARALLFPSKAEGFGLPLVEALASGVPVIASDLPVFREIGQGIPKLLDPSDAAAWEAAILDFANEPSGDRAAQLRKLETYRPPTWDDHFRTVEDWLRLTF